MRVFKGLVGLARDFTADDFPALGGDSSHTITNGLASLHNPRTQQSQEQASAAAALAHRQGLLGNITGSGNPSGRSVIGSGMLPSATDDPKRVGPSYTTTASNW